jgi:type II secretory pathway pseudopilin PulG
MNEEAEVGSWGVLLVVGVLLSLLVWWAVAFQRQVERAENAEDSVRALCTLLESAAEEGIYITFEEARLIDLELKPAGLGRKARLVQSLARSRWCVEAPASASSAT